MRREHHWGRARTGRSVLGAVALGALLAGVTLASGGPGGRPSATPTASIDPALEVLLGAAAPTDRIAVTAVLRAQADPRSVKAQPAERHDAAIKRTLKGVALGAQGPVLGVLRTAERGAAVVKARSPRLSPVVISITVFAIGSSLREHSLSALYSALGSP